MSLAVSVDRRPDAWRQFGTSMSEASFGNRSEFSPLEDAAAVPEFKIAHCGGVGVSTAVMPPIQIKGHGGASAAAVYHVTRVNQESTLVVQGREPLRLAPNELVLNSSHAQLTWTVGRSYRASTMHFDAGLIGQYLDRPMELVGRRLKLPFDLAEVLGQIMDASLAMADAGRFAQGGDRLGASFLNVLALLPSAGETDESSQLVALDLRRQQIKTFIRRNYARQGLSVEAIAGHFQISPRYVQRALAAEGVCPSEYLKTCRLKAAEALLRTSEASITRIAFDCGFSSSALFSTEFRRYAGCTPREYRRRWVAES